MREIGASKRLLRRCQRFETVNYAALQGFSRTRRGARAARLLPEKRGRASKEATHYPDLQGKAKDGSDGTRTRDLRRDRPASYKKGLGLNCPLLCREGSLSRLFRQR